MASVAEMRAWLQTLPAESLEAKTLKRLQGAVTALSGRACRQIRQIIRHICKQWDVRRYANNKDRPLSDVCDDLETQVLETARVVRSRRLEALLAPAAARGWRPCDGARRATAKLSARHWPHLT